LAALLLDDSDRRRALALLVLEDKVDLFFVVLVPLFFLDAEPFALLFVSVAVLSEDAFLRFFEPPFGELTSDALIVDFFFVALFFFSG